MFIRESRDSSRLSLRAVFPGTARQGWCAKQSPTCELGIARTQFVRFVAKTAPRNDREIRG